MRTYENVKRDIGPETCSWFLSTRQYQDWLGLGERVFDSGIVKESGYVLSILGIRSPNLIRPLN